MSNTKDRIRKIIFSHNATIGEDTRYHGKIVEVDASLIEELETLIAESNRASRIDELNRLDKQVRLEGKHQSDALYERISALQSQEKIKDYQTFLELPDEDKEKILRKVINAANEEQRKTLQSQGGDNGEL